MSNLSEANRRAIRQYSEYWSAKLTDEDPGMVDKARGKLSDPLKAVQVGDVFRVEYTRAVLPGLTEALASGRPQAAVSAMQVVALLGTPRALEVIVENSSMEDQDDFGIRLWAAKSFPTAVRQGTLPQNEINKALRHFGHAARREESWLILRRQFEAIASVHSAVSRDVQLNILRVTTDRMAKNRDSSDLMAAAYPALKLLRDEYLRLDAVDQKPFGKELAPVLCDVCSVANEHWEDAQDDSETRQIYGDAIHISETLLFLIDPNQRPGQRSPQTKLGPAWQDRDGERFKADHSLWQAVLRRPPYSHGKP